MQQLQKDKSNAPTSKSRNNNDFASKMKLDRRPSFKRTSPMLQHPNPKTSLNHLTTSVYEWIVLFRILYYLDYRQGIWKWHFQCPATKVQQQSKLLAKLKPGCPTLQNQIHEQCKFWSSQILWRTGDQKQCHRKTVPSSFQEFAKWHVQRPVTQVQQNMICY